MNKTHLGHRARKRFGQNFLHDETVIHDIVDAINPQPGEVLVEIGPGLAALTEPVCERVDHLTVVELDRDLADRLEHHPFLAPKLTVFRGDALKTDFRQFAKDGQKLRVFGNLPYNISTPLIFHLLQFVDCIADMHFMLQKEVVDRLAAVPSTKAYGRVSVSVQQACAVEPVLLVPPGAFTPPPKVESAVVRLTPHQTPLYPVSSRQDLKKVSQMAFNQRRKTICNNLKEIASDEQLETLGINPGHRPETLSVEDFCNLANWYTEHASN